MHLLYIAYITITHALKISVNILRVFRIHSKCYCCFFLFVWKMKFDKGFQQFDACVVF